MKNSYRTVKTCKDKLINFYFGSFALLGPIQALKTIQTKGKTTTIKHFVVVMEQNTHLPYRDTWCIFLLSELHKAFYIHPMYLIIILIMTIIIIFTNIHHITIIIISSSSSSNSSSSINCSSCSCSCNSSSNRNEIDLYII